MSWQDCAARVEAGDPDRFAATMIAPVAVREKLFPLYAFNLELAEAAWASSEPMVCLMRLQFWSDALDAIREGRMIPAHEVLAELAPVIVGHDISPLDRMVAARQAEVARSHLASTDTLIDWLGDSSGGLMEMAGVLLGPHPQNFTDIGLASAIANWLRSVPELEARGLQPLPGDPIQTIRELADAGLAALNRADQRQVPANGRPALWPAFLARHLLTTADRTPERVRTGELAPGPLKRALILAATRATGRV